MAVRNASMQLPDSAVKLDQLIQQRINGSLKVSSLKLLSCTTFALPNGCCMPCAHAACTATQCTVHVGVAYMDNI